MAKAAPKVKYPRSVTEPIYIVGPGLNATPAESQKFYTDQGAEILSAQLKKIEALCSHYKIPSGAVPEAKFLLLAMKLAGDHVPGFKPEMDPVMAPSSGRNVRRSKRWMQRFLFVVETLQKMSVKQTGERLTAIKAAEHYVESFEADAFAGARNAKARAKRARTLANIISSHRTVSRAKAERRVH